MTCAPSCRHTYACSLQPEVDPFVDSDVSNLPRPTWFTWQMTQPLLRGIRNYGRSSRSFCGWSSPAGQTTVAVYEALSQLPIRVLYSISQHCLLWVSRAQVRRYRIRHLAFPHLSVCFTVFSITCQIEFLVSSKDRDDIWHRTHDEAEGTAMMSVASSYRKRQRCSGQLSSFPRFPLPTGLDFDPALQPRCCFATQEHEHRNILKIGCPGMPAAICYGTALIRSIELSRTMSIILCVAAR